MVLPNRPVILLTKLPMPLASVVLEVVGSVGLAEVLQHTPLAVTAYPPSDETVPPLDAEIAVIKVADTVLDTIGTCNVARVLKVTSVPYDVPTELVA
jgi:hypothetical protein